MSRTRGFALRALYVLLVALVWLTVPLVHRGMGPDPVMAAPETQAVQIHYTADVTPDDASLQGIFSTAVGSGASWYASGGELVMTTANLAAIFFGNDPSVSTVPWQIGDDNQGNFASLRARLAPNSGEWDFYLIDSAYWAFFTFLPGQVQYIYGEGQSGTVNLDTTVYHTYSFLMANGTVTYSIDDYQIYSGPPVVKPSQPNPSYDPNAKYLIVGDGSGPSGGGYGSMVVDDFTFVAGNQPPNQPSNVLPENGTTDTSLTPTLQSSAFSDPDLGDIHAASQWQITTTSGNYSSPIFDSGTDSSNLTQVTIPSGILSYSTTYYWQVRHQDNHGAWSDWSAETSFTTASPPNQSPNQPDNVGPGNGATDTSLTPTLQSSTFSDPDADDTHATSQWQITTSPGDYSNLAFSSGVDSSDLTQINLPSGILSYSTTYYWQVKYQDNDGAWSAWSAETSFTTAAPPNQSPNQPDNVGPGNGATDTSLTATLQSSTFSDLDTDDTHTASQWQITSTSGDYSSPVFDSGADSSDLTQINLPSGILSYSTSYYWRVRYQDSHGSWSAWSAETSFTTLPSAPLEEDSFIGSVPLPNEIPLGPGVPIIGFFALIFVLVFYFSATLFNSTFKENYGIISGWFRRRSEWLKPVDHYIRERTSHLPSIRPKGSRYLYALLLVVISAFIYCWLDPYFTLAMGLRGLALFLSLAFSILVVTYSYEGTQALLMVRRFRIPAGVKLYGVAILIAVICVFFSRIIHFHPGMTYGFVGAFALLSAKKPDRQQNAFSILISAAILLILSILAFHLRSFLPRTAGEGNKFWLLLAWGILTGIFVMGLEGLLFTLMPLTFMDGAKVAVWRKRVWVVVFSVALFLFILYILHWDGKIWKAAPNLKVTIMFGLMGLFLVMSGVFWLCFWLHDKRQRKQNLE